MHRIRAFLRRKTARRRFTPPGGCGTMGLDPIQKGSGGTAMQQRMKTHPLDPQRTEALLRQSPVASLATLNRDGTPYVTPVHFV